MQSTLNKAINLQRLIFIQAKAQLKGAININRILQLRFVKLCVPLWMRI